MAVPSGTPGLTVSGPFDGLGLRGNASSPVAADNARLPVSALLGTDGGGLDVALGVVLPVFQILNASCSLGLMDAAIAKTIAHVRSARFEHLDQTLADQPVTRQHVAAMKNRADAAATLVDDASRAGDRSGGRTATHAAIEGGRWQHRARGARHRHAGRRWRRVPQGHRDRTPFPRRPSFGGDGTDRRTRCRSSSVGHCAACRCSGEGHDARQTFHPRSSPYDPKVVTIWEGFKDWFATPRFAFDYVLYSSYEAQAEAHLAGHVDVTWDSPLAWVRTRRLAAAAPRAGGEWSRSRQRSDLTSVVLVRADSDITDSPACRSGGRHRGDRLAPGDAVSARPPGRSAVSIRHGVHRRGST